MKKLQRLELLKDFVQEAVDRGATSIESIHQYIADLPFEALEATGLLDRDKSTLRSKHQRTIGMVYGAIRRINHDIGQLISDQFENVEESKDVDDLLTRAAAPVAKPKPAAKKPAARKTGAKKAAVKKSAVAKKAAKRQ
ncbi:MAG: hypothetical protein NVS9B10_02140 [Nevskia sp.]